MFASPASAAWERDLGRNRRNQAAGLPTDSHTLDRQKMTHELTSCDYGSTASL
jgi:hypothetical protein